MPAAFLAGYSTGLGSPARNPSPPSWLWREALPSRRYSEVLSARILQLVAAHRQLPGTVRTFRREEVEYMALLTIFRQFGRDDFSLQSLRAPAKSPSPICLLDRLDRTCRLQKANPHERKLAASGRAFPPGQRAEFKNALAHNFRLRANDPHRAQNRNGKCATHCENILERPRDFSPTFVTEFLNFARPALDLRRRASDACGRFDRPILNGSVRGPCPDLPFTSRKEFWRCVPWTTPCSAKPF